MLSMKSRMQSSKNQAEISNIKSTIILFLTDAVNKWKYNFILLNSTDYPTDFKITDSEKHFNTRLNKLALNILKNDRGHAAIPRESNFCSWITPKSSSLTSVHSWYCTNFGLLGTLHKEKLESFANLPRQIFVAEDLQIFRKAKPTKD